LTQNSTVQLLALTVSDCLLLASYRNEGVRRSEPFPFSWCSLDCVWNIVACSIN